MPLLFRVLIPGETWQDIPQHPSIFVEFDGERKIGRIVGVREICFACVGFQGKAVLRATGVAAFSAGDEEFDIQLSISKSEVS